MKITVAVLDKRGENAAPKIIEALKALSSEGVSRFGVVTPSAVATAKDTEGLGAQKVGSPVAVGLAKSKHSKETELVKLEDATVVFE